MCCANILYKQQESGAVLAQNLILWLIILIMRYRKLLKYSQVSDYVASAMHTLRVDVERLQSHGAT